MKIQTSDVQTFAQVSQELNVSVNSTLEFKQTLLGLVNTKTDEVEVQPTVETSETTETTELKAEVYSLRQQIEMLILELILIQFLGVEPKEAKEIAAEKMACKCEEEQNTPEAKMLVQIEISFERTIEYQEKTELVYQMQALIQTEDEEINLNLDIAFSQEFYEKHHEALEFTEVTFLDPLIIQYDKSSIALDLIDSELNFKFDLNSDGELEELSSLKEGNGFLAIDKNHNGIIDNGTELFGPNTNNGFEELREFDSGENGLIDENDSVFKDLLIWSRNQEGEDELIALGDVDVGAIYLKDSETSLNINRAINDPLAHLKSTSFFLREDGTAGLLSSLDFIDESSLDA